MNKKFKFAGHSEIKKPSGSGSDSWFRYTCGHCGAHTSGAIVARHGDLLWLQCTDCANGSVLDREGNLHPGALFGPEIQGLPDETANAYSEARRSMSVSAYTGAELICRKILMHVAVDKGAKEGESFSSYLDHLESEGYITPPMKGWVDLIRQHGNMATHVLEEPDRGRAESTLMFTAELLRIVYEMDYLSNKYTSTEETEEEESTS